jgi:hypothetical protein
VKTRYDRFLEILGEIAEHLGLVLEDSDGGWSLVRIQEVTPFTFGPFTFRRRPRRTTHACISFVPGRDDDWERTEAIQCDCFDALTGPLIQAGLDALRPSGILVRGTVHPRGLPVPASRLQPT